MESTGMMRLALLPLATPRTGTIRHWRLQRSLALLSENTESVGDLLRSQRGDEQPDVLPREGHSEWIRLLCQTGLAISEIISYLPLVRVC